MSAGGIVVVVAVLVLVVVVVVLFRRTAPTGMGLIMRCLSICLPGVLVVLPVT